MKSSSSPTSELTYDEAVVRIEEIVSSLEQAQALSVSEYKRKAAEAKQWLDYCENQLKKMADDFGA